MKFSPRSFYSNPRLNRQLEKLTYKGVLWLRTTMPRPSTDGGGAAPNRSGQTDDRGNPNPPATAALDDEVQRVILDMENGDINFKDVPERLRGNKAVVLAAVNLGRSIGSASKDLQGDREVVMAAVKHNGYELRFAAEELQGDKGVVMAAVTQNGDALCHASEPLKNNKEVAMAAVAQNGHALRYVSEGLRGDEEVAAMAQNGGTV
jgi:hypothetical protein